MNRNSVVGASSGRGFANFKYKVSGASTKVKAENSFALQQPSSQTTQITQGVLSGLLGPSISDVSCQPVKSQVSAQVI